MGFVAFRVAAEAALENIRRTSGLVIPSFGFGVRDLQIEDAPPRVTWVPLSGTASGGGGGRGVDRKLVTNPWSLWTRNVNVVAHVWSEDEAAAEQLAEQVVQAVDTVGHGAYKMLGEEWDTSSVGNAGVRLLVSFSIEFPWTQISRAVGKATTVDINSSMAGQS